MRRSLMLIAALVVGLFAPRTAVGQLLVQDDFSYTAGTDLSANGWNKTTSTPAQNGVTIVEPGLTYPGYIGSGAGNAAYFADFTERYSRSLTVPASGNIYAAFMIKVDTATATGGYAVSFYSNNASRGRFWFKNDGSGNLKFGLSGKSASAPVTYDTTAYTFGTTYLVVLKYIIVAGTTNDQYALIVNPLPGKPEPAVKIGPNTDTGSDLGANTAGSSLSIQSRDSVGTGARFTLDGIRVSQVWADVMPPPPFYYDGSGALEDVANWGDNNNGTGNHPVDFAADGQLYFITNTPATTLSAVWGVYGTGSKVIVGGGTNLTVGTGGWLIGTVDVSSGGTLTLTHADWPTFGTNGGTVSFNNPAGITLIENKTLSAGSGNYVLTTGDLTLGGFTLTVKGRFSPLTNKVTGTGTFKLDSAGTIIVGSPAGITASTAAGNIQSTVRTFSRYANYIFSSPAAQVTGDAIPDTVASLTVNATAGTLTVGLSKSVTVTGNLNLTLGKLVLGSNHLTFSNPAGQSDSSYVVTDGAGALFRPILNTGRKTMPVGSGTEYRPAVIQYEATPLARNVGVRYVSGDAGSAGYPTDVTQHFTDGSWFLQSDSSVGGTFRLELNVPAFADTTKLRIITRPNPSTAWTFAGTVGSYSAGWVIEAGVAAFAQFAIGAGASAPPPPPGKRYQSEVFATHTLQSNIQFGQAPTKTLYLDLYTGTNDSTKNRPLVIFIHGGGFKGGDKVGNFSTLLCGGLARRGYVVASINYRTVATIASDTAHFEAMLRALQDAKAAVRFFRANASTYGINPSEIFATGSSAGSITALHLAYLDSSEVPSYVTWANVDGSFEGTSGSPGYSTAIKGVINNWGAIGDTTWMKRTDPPVYAVHGVNDSTVFYEQVPADGPFKYGSKHIYAQAQRLGLRSGLRTFFNTGHTLDDNATKQDSAYKDMAAWLYTLLDSTTTSVPVDGAVIPSSFDLLQNYPNPFNPSTTIRFQLPTSNDVSLTVINMLGQTVATLAEGPHPAGQHVVVFDASRLATGMYFYRLRAGDFVRTHKMLLVK